ncbi:DNA polymerase V [Ceratocystis lukuohia]|uniref:DNA polymerase V n=1 Tax=Ceratocystis lukuohia TaxID=2019550 RepID=A0ABR4MB64_9PEZI
MGSKRKRSNNKDGQVKKARPSDIPPMVPPGDMDSDTEETPATDGPSKTITTALRPFPTTPVDLKQPTESLDIKDRIGEALLYDRLGSEDDTVRSAAALAILKGLLGSEANEGVAEEELQRHLEKRLFAGLASGRNASRVGLSLVLTEILFQLFGAANAASKYPEITFESVLERLVKLNETIGNVPGQQERDVFFGQLFGIECFVKAKILAGEPKRWISLLNLLLRLAERKVWLRPQCCWIIAQALGQLTREQTQMTLERLAKEGLAKTSDSVGIWLQARKTFPNLEVKPWGNPLSAKALSDLATVLKETAHDDGGEVHETRKTKVPNATSQLHFAWDLLAEHFHNLGNDCAREFNSFWVRVVDDGLFSKTATNGQKLRGFLVFQKLLTVFALQHDLIRVLFSRNLMACLMNQAAKEDRFLHIAAQRALKSVSDLASCIPSTAPVLVKAVLGSNGSYAFDARTNSKTVEKTLQKTQASEASDIVAFLEQRLRETTGPDSADSVAHLHAYVEYLYKLMDSSEAPENKQADAAGGEGSAASLAIHKLAQLAYAPAKEAAALGLTEKTKDLCKTRLESAFAKLSRRTEDMTYLCHAIAAIDPDMFDMEEEISTELAEARKQMKKLLKPATSGEKKTKASKEKSKADKKSKKDVIVEEAKTAAIEDKNDEAVRKGLALMYAVSIFQLYNDDPDALNMLNDLKQYQKQFKARSASKKKAKDDSEGDEDPVFALFVEILLSMVARPSSLTRQVSKQVFEAFSSYITAAGLQALVTVLNTSEDMEGQRALFENTDEMELDEGETEDGKKVDADADMVDLDDMSVDGDSDLVAQISTVNAGDSDSDSDSESNPEPGSDESESEEDDGEDHEAFDKKLAAVLRTHRADADADASSGSESDMSDGEMLALDDKIAAAFKSRRNEMAPSRKATAAAKEATLNFKHRVLDLLDIFVRVQAMSPLAFTLLAPLVALVNRTSSKPLASRAVDVLLTHQKTLRKELTPAVVAASRMQIDGLLEELRNVHEAVALQGNNSAQFAKAASTASLALASALYALDKEAIEHVVMEYGVVQTGWIAGRIKIHTSFFSSWLNWCQSRAQANENKKA